MPSSCWCILGKHRSSTHTLRFEAKISQTYTTSLSTVCGHDGGCTILTLDRRILSRFYELFCLQKQNQAEYCTALTFSLHPESVWFMELACIEKSITIIKPERLIFLYMKTLGTRKTKHSDTTTFLPPELPF